MFASRLNNIYPYTNDIVDKVMDNIRARSYNNDQTMLANLRAIIAPRLEKDEIFNGYTEDVQTVNLNPDAINSVNNQFSIINICNNGENIFAQFDEKAKELTDFNELKDIESYLKEKCDINCRLLASTTHNVGIIYVQRMNIRTYHLMQSFIHRCFPRIFKDKPITEKEKEVLRGLTKSSSDAYINAIGELAKEMNLRDIILDKLVKGFEKKNNENVIRTLENEYQNWFDKIERILEEHRQAIRQMNEVNMKINGLKYTNKESEEDVLYDYLKSRKNIDIINVEGNLISININTYLEHYDAEMWMSYRRNGSVVENYKGTNPDFEKSEDRQLLLDAVFSENPILKVKMVGGYDIDIRGHISNRCLEGTVHDTCPNPHLEFHHCLGGHGPKIQEAIRMGDMILAIEQCAASAASVNLAEIGPTFGPMLRNWFIWTDRKMFVNKDKTEMTASEALKWLKETGYTGINENKVEFEEEKDETYIPF